MRVLVATDAWHPQVNGVVRTLTSLAQNTRNLGVTIDFLSPEGMRSIPCQPIRACGWAAEPARECPPNRSSEAQWSSRRY